MLLQHDGQHALAGEQQPSHHSGRAAPNDDDWTVVANDHGISLGFKCQSDKCASPAKSSYLTFALETGQTASGPF